MHRLSMCAAALAAAALPVCQARFAVAEQPKHYFAHRVVEDRNGVVAPWYEGLSGQCDFRVRVAVETMKRYPWSVSKSGLPAPDYMFNGRWSIAADGTITPGELRDWGNGDLVQRAAYSILGLIDYYRYSGDPAAVAHASMFADVILAQCLTPEGHPWPRFPVSVPMRGEPYGVCDPRGMIQLDLAALFGIALTRAYEMTGRTDWLDIATHWGEVLSEHCSGEHDAPPWNRYANPEHAFWDDLQTGGAVLILQFLDELLRVGRAGRDNCIHWGRDRALDWIRGPLMARFWKDDTWARDYWDWTHDVQSESISEFAARLMMASPEEFPDWQRDVRNMLTLFMQRACVAPESGGGVFSGAWAYPEGAQCCGRSLSYPPMQIGAALAEYAVRADSAWARELARRQFIIATYDCHETGVVEDGMDGGQVVAGGWFQVTHPLALKYVLDGIAWLPEELGASRENHLVRTSSTVSRITYEDGRIRYRTFDAPSGGLDVLRLAYRPRWVLAGGNQLEQREDLEGNGYTARSLPNGDWILTIRHDGSTEVEVSGDDDPQRDAPLEFAGPWERRGSARVATSGGATATLTFTGNQVRIIGDVGPDGGQADIEIDGARQLCGIDSWNPARLEKQVLFARSGLNPGRHTIRLIALGKHNPRSSGTEVVLYDAQVSSAEGHAGFGEGGGPAETQRWILGYANREDHVDSQGNTWRPGTEIVARIGQMNDPVVAAWHTHPRRQFVSGTEDPVLYRHGFHAPEFTAYATVAPGTYYVRVKLMETRTADPPKRGLNIDINRRRVAEKVDVAATATGRPAEVEYVSPNGTRVWKGLNTAVDLVFDNIQPVHGVIEMRFSGTDGGEAVVSAIEIGAGSGGEGHHPIPATMPSTLPVDSRP